jgi:hypothetical protein
MPFGQPTPGRPIGRPGVGHPSGLFGVFSYYWLMILVFNIVPLIMEFTYYHWGRGMTGDVKTDKDTTLLIKKRTTFRSMLRSSPSTKFWKIGEVSNELDQTKKMQPTTIFSYHFFGSYSSSKRIVSQKIEWQNSDTEFFIF